MDLENRPILGHLLQVKQLKKLVFRISYSLNSKYSFIEITHLSTTDIIGEGTFIQMKIG